VQYSRIIIAAQRRPIKHLLYHVVGLEYNIRLV